MVGLRKSHGNYNGCDAYSQGSILAIFVINALTGAQDILNWCREYSVGWA